MASSMEPVHLFSQDNLNQVQYKFLGHIMPLKLVSLSHEANNVSNGTIQFVRLR